MESKQSFAETMLVFQTVSAMDTLEIPRTHKEGPLKTGKDFEYLDFVNQDYVLNHDVFPMIIYGPKREVGHTLRMAQESLVASDILGLDEDAKRLFFCICAAHDLGKIPNRKLYPENARDPHHLNPKHLDQFKKRHVEYSNLPRKYGEIASTAIAFHHKYQDYLSPSYFPDLPYEPSEEGSFLSKPLAILDGYDALYARLSRTTNKYLSNSQVKDTLMRAYGGLQLKYNGKLFTKVDMQGEEFILQLYERGMFGRTKPRNICEEEFRINPFGNVKIE